MNNKTMKTIAGIIFLGLFAYRLPSFIRIIALGGLYYLRPISIIIIVVRLACLLFWGVASFNNKKLGKISIAAAIVYVAITLYNLAGSIRYSFPTVGFLLFIVFIAAYGIAMKAKNGSVFDVKDTASEAAKKQYQAEKQASVYDQQLKDGIITQEEYDQLTKNK